MEPVLGTRRVRLRKDGRYGPDDPIQWPQPFSSEHCHYSSIPEMPRPGDTSHEYHDYIDIWRSLQLEHLSHVTTPVGDQFLLRKERWAFLDSCTNLVHSRLREKAAVDLMNRGTNRALVSCYRELMKMAANSLKYTPASYQKQVVIWSVFLRGWLYSLAWHSYMTRNRDLMDGNITSTDISGAVVNQNCIGCFSFDPIVIQMHRRAGIPIWTVRKSNTFSSEKIMRVRKVYLHDDDVYGVKTCLTTPYQAAIFEGPADSDAKYTAIIRNCQSLFVMENAFSTSAPSTVSSSAAAASPLSRSSLNGGRACTNDKPSPIRGTKEKKKQSLNLNGSASPSKPSKPGKSTVS